MQWYMMGEGGVKPLTISTSVSHLACIDKLQQPKSFITHAYFHIFNPLNRNNDNDINTNNDDDMPPKNHVHLHVPYFGILYSAMSIHSINCDFAHFVFMHTCWPKCFKIIYHGGNGCILLCGM